MCLRSRCHRPLKPRRNPQAVRRVRRVQRQGSRGHTLRGTHEDDYFDPPVGAGSVHDGRCRSCLHLEVSAGVRRDDPDVDHFVVGRIFSATRKVRISRCRKRDSLDCRSWDRTPGRVEDAALPHRRVGGNAWGATPSGRAARQRHCRQRNPAQRGRSRTAPRTAHTSNLAHPSPLPPTPGRNLRQHRVHDNHFPSRQGMPTDPNEQTSPHPGQTLQSHTALGGDPPSTRVHNRPGQYTCAVTLDPALGGTLKN